jgi:conjugative transfer pilus assembly protein TraH
MSFQKCERRGVDTVSRIVAVTFAVILIAFANPCYADGWVDDWLDQSSSTSPSHFEGQKRGYFTAGNFSARWLNTNDYLFTAETPKIKAGCGGIDVFLGGFSFLDFEYLVDKFQRILQSAPAAAFDIALNVLCEQCSQTISKLEAFVDQLNQIQLDDCKASRAMVAKVMSPFADSETEKQKLAAIQNDFMISSGMANLAYENNKETEANDNLPITDLKQALAGCPQDLKDVFATSGSLIANLSEKIGLKNSGYVDLIRGYVGDIIILEGANIFTAAYVGPCEKNKKMRPDGFINGRAQARNASMACYEITDKNKDLENYVRTKMLTLANHIRYKQKLNQADLDFITANAFPVHRSLTLAVRMEQESLIVNELSIVVARAFAMRMLDDLYTKAYSLLTKGENLVSAQKSGKTERPSHECKVEMLDSAMQGLHEMQERILELQKGLAEHYKATQAETTTAMEIIERMEKFYSMQQDLVTGLVRNKHRDKGN